MENFVTTEETILVSLFSYDNNVDKRFIRGVDQRRRHGALRFTWHR